MKKNRIIFTCSIAIIFIILIKFLPVYFFLQGEKAYKEQNYTKAYEYLRKAYHSDKKNQDYRYYYINTLLNLAPNVKIQSEVLEIAQDNKNDSAKKIAQEQIFKWKRNVLYNIGDNYIEQTPMDKGILRWDIETFPLKVHISNKSNIELPNYYNTEILRAFSQWQTSVSFLQFVITKNKKDANIIVEIKPSTTGNCEDNTNCKYVVGYTTPNIKGKILKNMNIVLYSKDPLGKFFSDKEIYNTCLHEIGHSIGIMGHSYNSDDLMHMSTENDNIYSKYRSSFQYLSTKDINTVKLLYKLIPDITNTENINTKGLIYTPIILGSSKEISARKLKEAQNYIKNAPDLPSGYIDLGIAYAELNMHKEAINALKKSFQLSQTDDEKYLSAYNLASLYIHVKDANNAEKYANIAKQISNTEEVQELFKHIKNIK